MFDNYILVSSSPDRSNARPLTGALLKGDVYIFVNDQNINSASYYLDTQGDYSKAKVTSAKAKAPYDFAYTQTNGSARPFNSTQLTNGWHALAVIVRNSSTGAYETHASLFGVGNKTVTPPTTPPTVPPTVPPTNPPTSDWKLTFSDEFSGSSIDTTKWNVYDEDNPWNSVSSPKSTTCPESSNLVVSSGTLKMNMKRSQGECKGKQPASGAELNTLNKFTQSGGKWEVRSRLSDAGNYLWTGFWTTGNFNDPETGFVYAKNKASEIDIMEYIGKNAEPNISRFKPAVHTNYTCSHNNGCESMLNHPYNGIDVTQWHTYALEWGQSNPSDPTTVELKFFIDSKLIMQFDKTGITTFSANGTKTKVNNKTWVSGTSDPFPAPFNIGRKHMIHLSAWVGAPSTDPATSMAAFNPKTGIATYEVDYVRVYKK